MNDTTPKTKSRRGGKRAGAGAPLAGEGPSVVLNLRLAPSAAELVRAEAARTGASASDVIRAALERYVQSDEPSVALALNAGLQSMLTRINAPDMIGVSEAAQLAGGTVTAVQSACRSRRLIGLKVAGHVASWRLPRWQFDGDIMPHIPALAETLQAADGWAVLRFLEEPAGGLDGQTPRQALERGRAEDVLRLAAAAAH